MKSIHTQSTRLTKVFLITVLCVITLPLFTNCDALDDTHNAIDEIENNLKAIENDHSLPSSEEHSAYNKHFNDNSNSLDSHSDFGYDEHGHNHSSIKSKSHHDHTEEDTIHHDFSDPSEHGINLYLFNAFLCYSIYIYICTHALHLYIIV